MNGDANAGSAEIMSYGARELAAEQWHLLLCKPNQNQIAFRNLTRLGFDVFMPRHKTERRWKGRLRQQLHPIFGGYIFLSKGASGQDLHLAKTAPGVSTFVGFGSAGPAVVPAGIVAGLMSRCDHEGLLAPQVDAFDVGDPIRIVSGPFADFVTSVEHIDPDRRLHVLLELLGRQTRVQVDPDLVVRRL